MFKPIAASMSASVALEFSLFSSWKEDNKHSYSQSASSDVEARLVCQHPKQRYPVIYNLVYENTSTRMGEMSSVLTVSPSAPQPNGYCRYIRSIYLSEAITLSCPPTFIFNNTQLMLWCVLLELGSRLGSRL